MADGRRVLDSILSEFDTAEREAWLNRARLYGSGPLREAIAARDRAMPSSNITRSGSSGFDINKFLRELPRVEEKDFPREPENVCSICHIVHAAEDPDTGYTEFPVRLPCGHIIGKACICKWLKKGPEGSNANNCPICRHQFFEPWPAPQRRTLTRHVRNLRLPRVRNNEDAIPPAPGAPQRTRSVTTAIPPAPGAPQRTGSVTTRTTGPVPIPQPVQPDLRQSNTRMLSDATQQITLDMFRRYSDSPQGQSVFASAVYVIEAAGWSLGPFLGANSTAANRDSVRAEYASNRRHVAMMERQLYTALNTHGINLPGPADENLWGNEILDARQDQALFNWLHNHNAFAGFRLNEEFRKESFGPRSGRVRTNAEIWDMLRDLGCWLTIHPDYTGHWYKANQPLYTPEEEELTDTFQELLSEGAFATRGIMQEFAGRDEYYIFRRALEMRISWNINHGVWTHRGGPPLFGDQPRTPEQRQNDLLSQVRDGTAGIVLQERQITLPRRPPTPELSQAPTPVPDEDRV